MVDEKIHPNDFACNKEPGDCKRCGACCIVRSGRILDVQDEERAKRMIFSKTGVVYLHPLHHYTLSLTHEEKDRYVKLAEKHDIDLKIAPKKLILGSDGIVYVLDWYIDHDNCPFLEENGCIIYDSRSKVCSDFPEINMDENEAVNRIQDSGIEPVKDGYEKVLDKVKTGVETENIKELA